VSVVVAGLLALVVGATIVEASHPSSKKHVYGDVAPPLQAFLNDPRVEHELAHKGFVVDTRATNPDFTFSTDPSDNSVSVFSTPLVVHATPADAARLQHLGVAENNGGVWSIDPANLLRAITAREVAIQSGGPTSPAGSYFAALLAGTQPNADITTLVNAISPAFKRQPTGVPVLDVALASDTPPNGAVVMYPNPDVVANANVSSHSALGAQFVHMLATDATLRQYAPAAPAVPIHSMPLPSPAAFSQLSQILDTATHI
jgi:hypothetical protein